MNKTARWIMPFVWATAQVVGAWKMEPKEALGIVGIALVYGIWNARSSWVYGHGLVMA